MNKKQKEFIVGVDEAGRGALAGPVVAAAVLLGPTEIPALADSKKLTEKQRAKLSDLIIEECIAYAIAEASVEEIEKLNILEATLIAMQRAVSGIVIVPDKVLIDGNITPDLPYPSEAIIKGDDSVPEIMAASILAKHQRDQLMYELDKQYPKYEFAKHKGYGTAEHLANLQQYKPSDCHRAKFAPVAELL